MGITAGLIVGLRGTIPAASAGLALAYASQLSGIMQYVVRLACETESRFTSVQRMQTYLLVKSNLIKGQTFEILKNYFMLFLLQRLWKAKIPQL